MNTAIIFDMDGTIIDSEPLYTKAEIRLFAEYNVIIPKEDLHLFRGCSETDFFNLSMSRYKISEKKSIFIEKGRRYVKEEFKKGLSFMPGFHDLIFNIKNKHQTALVTASPRHNLDWVCEIMNLNNYFDCIISGEDCKYNKPHPQPYLDMMEMLNVKPQNTIIVEDSIHGLNSALSSKAHVIAIRGSVSDDSLNKSHKIISSLSEITNKLIDELLQKKL